MSQSRSQTSQGTGLANKISNAISRILSNQSCTLEDDDVADLVSLLKELNLHTELTVKLSSTNKINTILSKADSSDSIF